jgi:hypothetical protein
MNLITLLDFLKDQKERIELTFRGQLTDNMEGGWAA